VKKFIFMVKLRNLPEPPEQLVRTAATYVATNFLPHAEVGMKALRVFITLLARRFEIRESRVIIDTTNDEDLPWVLAKVLAVTLPDIELARSASDEMLKVVSEMFSAGETLNDSAERAQSQERSESLQDISAVFTTVVENLSAQQMKFAESMNQSQKMLADTLRSIASGATSATADPTGELQRISKSRSKTEASSGINAFDDAPQVMERMERYVWLKDDPQAAPLRRACYAIAEESTRILSAKTWAEFLGPLAARMQASQRHITPTDAAYLQSYIQTAKSPGQLTWFQVQSVALFANPDISIGIVERLRLARIMPAQHDASEAKSWASGASNIPNQACQLPVRADGRRSAPAAQKGVRSN